MVPAAFAFVAGIYLCGYTSKALGVHDHGGIVWDEFVGYWITMIAVPASWQWILAGFVLFRLFDIVKPWPVKVADAKRDAAKGRPSEDSKGEVARTAVATDLDKDRSNTLFMYHPCSTSIASLSDY